MSIERIAAGAFIVVGVVAVLFVLYVLVATSLYLASASWRWRGFVRITSRVFAGMSSRIEAMRASMPAERLRRTDTYILRGTARLGSRVLRVSVTLIALVGLLWVIAELL